MGVDLNLNGSVLTIEDLIESFHKDPKIGEFDEEAVRARYIVLCERDKVEKAHGKPGWMRRPWKLLYNELVEANAKRMREQINNGDGISC